MILNSSWTYLLLLWFVALTLQACQSHQNDVHVRFEQVTGLKTGDPVLLDTNSVGLVRAIELEKDLRVLVTLDIRDGLVLPIDSRFELVTVDVFGHRGIRVHHGIRQDVISPEDTLEGQYRQTMLSNADELTLLLEKMAAQLILAEEDSLLTYVESLRKRIDSIKSVRAQFGEE